MQSLPIYTCVNGKDFNAACSGKKLYKVLPESMTSAWDGFKYKVGLNVVKKF
jgi:hypothetical protein